MRFCLLGSLVVLGCSLTATTAQAQVPFGNINDPFFAYYSFYLPRQQAQALSPGPEATINAVTANRQQYAATNRNGMFDPNGAGSGGLEFGEESLNGGNGQRRRTLSGLSSGRFAGGVHGGNLNGLGPQGYYGGGKLVPYYRDLKTGRGKNANVSVVRGRGFGGGGGGGGYGGLGGGLPGPR